MKVRIASIDRLAIGVMRLELVPLNAPLCPIFDAGAHIDVHLPNGMVRQYSLTNFSERHRYVIAVGLDPRGRGGSAWMHSSLQPGDAIEVGTPRNNFVLDDSLTPAVLIAGGIGITPIWAMVQSLEQRGREWTLYYCARTSAHAAFLKDIEAFARGSRLGRLICHFDQEPGQRMLDLFTTLQQQPSKHHFYCCGPQPMLDAFTEAAARNRIPADRLHVEYFSAPPVDTSADTAFEVQVRNGTVYRIPPDQSILDVLAQAGEAVMYSCKEGICGTCETAVLHGEPLHRDAILSPAERAGNQTMMICVSRCKAGRLTLDI